MKVVCAAYISFHTIVTNYYEPLAAAWSHIHVSTLIDISKDRVALRSIDLHQVLYDAVGSSRLQVQFAWAENISFHTIVTNYYEPLAAAQAHMHVVTHKRRSYGSSTLHWPSSGRIWDCSIVATSVVSMSRVQFLPYYRYQLLWTTSSGTGSYSRHYTHNVSQFS